MGESEIDRAKEILALGLESGGDLPTFLDSACGDDHSLSAAVTGLLDPSDAARLEALRSPADLRHRRLNEGDRIGPYEILGILGEGGFGIVYRAAQEKPVVREVAIKVLKAGMDSEEVVSRFEAERQALAVMEHGAIAQIYDAGTTETGLPYFVMELVRGDPINQFAASHALKLPDLLELFIQVCEGVHHAHQRGIIHRDLKPSNVLIRSAEQGEGEATVKIIDFGIAKALGQSLTEQTLLTMENRVLGTPSYMSPEQASGNPLLVDTRSDVYALGVMLYELLSGSTPITRQEAKSAAVHEILRMIREDQPVAPSSRIATTVLATKGDNEEPVTIISSATVKGELDWVTMRALEKEPDRRYGSASEMASDLRRHLLNEPVEAGPPSRIYKFQKFATRNRGYLAAATLALLSVMAAAIFATGQALRARTSEKRALAARDEAQGLVDFMLDDLQKELAPIGRLDLLQSVLDRAGGYSSVVTDETHGDAARLATLQTIGQQVSLATMKYDMDAIHPLFLEAEALIVNHPEVIATLDGLIPWGEVILGHSWASRQNDVLAHPVDALREFVSTISPLVIKEHGTEAEQLAAMLSLSANCGELLSLPPELLTEEQTDEIRGRFDEVVTRLDAEFGEAPEVIVRMLKYQEEDNAKWVKKCVELFAQSPDDTSLLTEYLSWAPEQTSINIWGTLEAPLRRAVIRDPTNHQLRTRFARLLSRMSYVYFTGGRKREARDLIREALPHYEAVLAAAPELWWIEDFYTAALGELSRTSGLISDFKTAAESGERAMELGLKLVESPPAGAPPTYLASAIRSYIFDAHHRSIGLIGLERYDEAAEVCGNMIRQLPEYMRQMETSVPNFFEDNAHVYIYYLYVAAWRAEVGKENFEEAIRLNREIQALLPASAEHSVATNARVGLVQLLQQAGYQEEAEQLAKDELLWFESLDSFGNMSPHSYLLMSVLEVLIGKSQTNRERVESVSAQVDGIFLDSDGRPKYGGVGAYHENPATKVFAFIAKRLQHVDSPHKAAKAWETVWHCKTATRKQLVKEGKVSTPTMEIFFANYAREAAVTYAAIGAPTRAIDVLLTAKEELEGTLQREPENKELWSALVRIYKSLAKTVSDPKTRREYRSGQIAALRGNLSADPANPVNAKSIAWNLVAISNQVSENEPETFDTYLQEEAKPLLDGIMETFGEDSELLLAASKHAYVLMNVARRDGDTALAVQHAEERVRLAKSAASYSPADDNFRSHLAIAEFALGRALASANQPEKRFEHLKLALAAATPDTISEDHLTDELLTKSIGSAGILAIRGFTENDPQATEWAAQARTWLARLEARNAKVENSIRVLVETRLLAAEEAAP